MLPSKVHRDSAVQDVEAGYFGGSVQDCGS